MNFPIRCFTCGLVIAKYYGEYKKRLDNGETPQIILNSFKIGRMCCRRMFLGHTDNEEMLLMYPTYPGGIHRLDYKKSTDEEDDKYDKYEIE